MTKVITFNALRQFKDSLPHGSMQLISEKMGIDVETVRNYFGGQNFKDGNSCGIHIEAGPDGGLVTLNDTAIYDLAEEIAKQNQH